MNRTESIEFYNHPTGGNTIKVRGQAASLLKLDQTMNGYLERDEKGNPLALYIHMTRKEDEDTFWKVFFQLK